MSNDIFYFRTVIIGGTTGEITRTIVELFRMCAERKRQSSQFRSINRVELRLIDVKRSNGTQTQMNVDVIGWELRCRSIRTTIIGLPQK